MTEANQLRLKVLWDKAFKEYYNTQQQIDQQTEEKKSKRLFSHRKDDTEKIVVSKPPPPKGMSVDDFKTEISRNQEAFIDMRMKHHKIFDVLGAMAEPIQVIGGQASAIGGMFSPAAPMVFSAVMYLFSTGKKVAADLDAMAELFYRCNEHMTQISLLVKARQLATELQDVIVGSLIAILDVCRISTYYIQRGRLKAFVLTLGGAGGGEAHSALARLKDLAQGRDSTTIGATYVAVDELQEKSDRLLTNVSGISDQVLETQNMIMKKLSSITKSDEKQASTTNSSTATVQKFKEVGRDALCEFLKPDFSIADRFRELHKSTAPDTCEWIFKEHIGEQKFLNWIRESNDPMLWIYGQSGCGKSHLAAKILERFGPSHLLGDNDASKAAVAAYFFDYSGVTESDEKSTALDKSTENVENKSDTSKEETTEEQENKCINEMLRTVCWQLCQDDKKYQDYLAGRLTKLKKDIPRENSTPPSSIWNSLFNIPYFIDFKDRPIVFVIDGVDNLSLSDRSVFYTLLEEVTKISATNSAPKIKLIILSQADNVQDEISNFDWSFAVPNIFITDEKNHSDIENFISGFVQKSRKLRRALADKSFREEVVHKLALTTHGVFEMATLLMKQLEQKDHVDLVDEVLEAPPENIQSLLRQTVEHFSETHTDQDIEDLNSLLAWVLYGYDQPLSLEQLNAAIGLESKHGEFLDIRDKIAREFSAYFSIIGDHKSQSQRSVSSNAGQEITSLANSPDQLSLIENSRKVKVAHASIATYFRNSGASDNKSTSIGMSRSVAHLRIARTCLLAMCSMDSPKKLRRRSQTEKLLSYAATNFYKHLAIARSSASPTDRLEIVQLLLKAFRDEKCIESWVLDMTPWPTWFVADGAIDEIWAWINNDDTKKKLPKEDIDWINEPNVSTQEKILKPICIWHGKKLLEDPNFEINNNNMYYFMYLFGFQKLFQQPLKPLSTETVHPYYTAQKLTEDEVRQVVDWLGFKKTPLWHTRLGYVLDDITGLKSGIEEWETAVKLDPNFGQPYFVLAYAHAKDKNYDLAIKQMKESRRLKYNIEGGSSRRGAIWISTWQQERAEAQDPGEKGIQAGAKEALKTLEDELQVFPNSFDLVSEHIKLASKARMYRTVMVSIRKLGSKLPEFLASEDGEDIHQEIRRAGQYTHNVSLLKNAYESAIALAAKEMNESGNQEIDTRSMSLLLATASLYSENQEDDKALNICDRILETYRIDDRWVVGRARMKKAELCWLGALNKSGSPEEKDENLDKLVEFEKEEHSPEIDPLQFLTGLLLGLYYRLKGDDETARPFFKDRIALGLSLLEDEDKDNDYEAYSILAHSLVKAGDIENGIAAKSLQIQELKSLVESQRAESESPAPNAENEPDPAKDSDAAVSNNNTDPTLPVKVQSNDLGSKSNTESEEKSQVETLNPEDYPSTKYDWGSCDGVCGRLLSNCQENNIVHTCNYCLDIDFCSDCFPKHQDGSLPYKLCDPDHEFAIAIGAPKNLPDHLVKVGDKIRERGEWLNSIREAWGLEVKNG